MIRTQIQLTDEQAEALKKLAAWKNESMSELVREAVDLFLRASREASLEERIAKAHEIAGRFVASEEDLSISHDTYLFPEHQP